MSRRYLAPCCRSEAMSGTIYRQLVLPLLVAFLVGGLLPAAGSWSCPDGTACVYTTGRGFHCLGDRCRMACCAVRKPSHACGCCEHGAALTTAATRAHHRTIRE